MGLGWRDWSRSDLLYGVIVPLAVVLVIVALSQVSAFLGFGGLGGAVYGILMEIEELIVIVAVPLILGLVWNRWAGGASGFLMGTIYALYWSDSYHGIAGSGTVLLAYILSGMLIGYMAGALNKRSQDFRRLVVAAVVATAIGGVLLFGVFQLSPANVITGWTGFLLTVFSRILVGVVVAAVAKVFFWYGIGMDKKSES